MAKEFAKAFYESDNWIRCRKAYAKSVGGLCESCLSKGIYTPGRIVHHKIRLTPDNINNPLISMGWGNLKLVCMDCHAQEHKGNRIARYRFDKEGNISPL